MKPESKLEQTIQKLEARIVALEYENKRLLEQLNQQHILLHDSDQRSESANRIKSEFLANISHEISTPMNAILGFSELLKQSITDSQGEKYIDSIQSNGKALMTLFHNILDLSKAEAGKLAISFEPINLSVILQDIKTIFAPKVREKGLKLKLKINGNIPSAIQLNETRLQQILFNLLSNAVKFTQEGVITIQIDIKLKSQPENINLDKPSYCDLNIKIIDTGIGISPTDQSVVFQSFQQSQDQGQPNRKYGGTGLGLTITKRLVETMGGKITLTSKLNRGSTFQVFFPNLKILGDISNNFISSESVVNSFNDTIVLNQIVENSVTISTKVRDKLPELLKLLKEMEKEVWFKLHRSLVMDQLRIFAHQLESWGIKYEYQDLLHYAIKLKNQINNFDLVHLPATVANFPEIITKLENFLTSI